MNSAAFDEFGRMTSNLGLEAVPATPAGQNILLYPYIAPPTEVIDGTNLPVGDVNVQAISSGTDGTQIWKITHNGVDTHPIHFHLFNVQLLNRVTWDNIIIPPEASELGWKETVRVSPLEDTIVAVRPIIPTLPFEVPNSIRPAQPDRCQLGANLDPQGLIVDPLGNVTTVTNALVNFGWEYVYHCHILSHEEMDMMRPVLLRPAAAQGGHARLRQDHEDADLQRQLDHRDVVRRPGVARRWRDVDGRSGRSTRRSTQPNIHRTGVSIAYRAPTTRRRATCSASWLGTRSARLTRSIRSSRVAIADIDRLLAVRPAHCRGPTTTTLTSAPNPSLVGENVTFTATVADASGIVPAGIPTGTVQFSIDGAAVGTPVALDALGVATYATSTLIAGVTRWLPPTTESFRMAAASVR